MSERKTFQISDSDMKALLDAMRPEPVMYASGGVPMFRSAQERANEAWEALGKKLGFKHMTVRPVAGKGPEWFTAEVAPVPALVELASKIRAADTEQG